MVKPTIPKSFDRMPNYVRDTYIPGLTTRRRTNRILDLMNLHCIQTYVIFSKSESKVSKNLIQILIIHITVATCIS